MELAENVVRLLSAWAEGVLQDLMPLVYHERRRIFLRSLQNCYRIMVDPEEKGGSALRFLSGLIGGCWLLGATVTIAIASPLVWNIPTLNFITGGGTVSGVFTYDADTNAYSAWSIDISGFSDPIANGLVTPSTSVVNSFSSSTFFDLSYASGQAEFDMGFGFLDSGFHFIYVPLTDSGGDAPGQAAVLDVPSFTSFNTGLLPVVASTTPEPMSAVLVLLGGVSSFICYKWRRGRGTSKC
jgi:hypothetical protein